MIYFKLKKVIFDIMNNVTKQYLFTGNILLNF